MIEGDTKVKIEGGTKIMIEGDTIRYYNRIEAK
jgi:hypothetical protein